MKQVHLEKSWYEQATSRQKAEMVLHELVRYHGIRLAQATNLTKEQSDEVVAAATALLLDPSTTPEKMYEQLSQSELILDHPGVSKERSIQIRSIMKMMTEFIKSNTEILKTCRTYPPSSRESLKAAYFISARAAETALQFCQNYYHPDDPEKPLKKFNKTDWVELYAQGCEN